MTTILVVSYNHAAYVEECLDSIAAQSVPCRLIVVDDASSDDTVERIRAWEARHAVDVEIIAHSINVGLGQSLAEGLERIDTEFFAYIAADDWMERDRIERQVALARDIGEGCGLVYSDCYRALADGVQLPELFSQTWSQVWTPDVPDVFGALLERNWIPAPTILLRTSAIRAVGGYDPDIFYEDHDVCLRIAREFTLARVDAPLATHRELATSLGAREFVVGSMRWRRARALLLAKHLDLDVERDGAISDKVLAITVELQDDGEEPAVVARLLDAVAAVRPLPWPSRARRLMAGLGLRPPGRLARRHRV